MTGDETHAFVKVGEHFTESQLQPVFNIPSKYLQIAYCGLHTA